jgi:hypothetical protein
MPGVRERLRTIQSEQITVSAVVVSGVLVMQNLREFQRLEGLRLKDWSGSGG